MISTPLSPTGSGGRRRSAATGGATPIGLRISISLAACSATTSSRCDRRPGPTSGPTAIPEISTKGPASSWCRCSARPVTRGNGRKWAVPTSCLWAARAVRGSGRVADCSAATSDAAGPYGLSCTIKPVPRPTQGVAAHRDRQRYRARDGAFCRSPHETAPSAARDGELAAGWWIASGAVGRSRPQWRSTPSERQRLHEPVRSASRSSQANGTRRHAGLHQKSSNRANCDTAQAS